jgi:hypothetical protein
VIRYTNISNTSYWSDEVHKYLQHGANTGKQMYKGAIRYTNVCNTTKWSKQVQKCLRRDRWSRTVTQKSPVAKKEQIMYAILQMRVMSASSNTGVIRYINVCTMTDGSE